MQCNEGAATGRKVLTSEVAAAQVPLRQAAWEVEVAAAESLLLWERGSLGLLEEYGLLLSHLHADGLLTMLVFQHLYEACVWIIPNVALFQHYFIPRLVNHVVTGDVTFTLRDAKEYISVEEAWPNGPTSGSF
ncbi:hypothetical protein QYE76_005924 [Lolium multiflorum]|uniref:Transposase (putative) gypsy type domain-containing protein n=1 Tax=Lolium multiflorum TaxID=4521 RepID=A0AAD8W2R0_LOLMU|nr:hypothetical protein QYE76_005924 [Lolium multiflorum]